jgi:hypothetical protein
MQLQRRVLLPLAATLLISAALAGPAAAATAPTVSTGRAQSVGFQSATLTGSINPNGKSTSYYFQYGLTKAYTSQTAIASAGAGSKALTVRAAITGLAPLTVYHYRLVAVNAAGVTMGGDHSFKTSPIPLSLQILAAPNPVSFGGLTIVQGTLSGTNNANRKVVLEESPFPFTAGFTAVPNLPAELTTSLGGFSFTVSLGGTTEFRVVTATNPPVISPVTTAGVVVRVTAHIARTRRHGFARFYGTVSPAENGAQVGILRVAGRHGILAGGTILAHRDAGSSKFSRVVRVHKGIYRVLVRVVNQPVGSSYSQPLRIR